MHKASAWARFTCRAQGSISSRTLPEAHCSGTRVPQFRNTNRLSFLTDRRYSSVTRLPQSLHQDIWRHWQTFLPLDRAFKEEVPLSRKFWFSVTQTQIAWWPKSRLFVSLQENLYRTIYIEGLYRSISLLSTTEMSVCRAFITGLTYLSALTIFLTFLETVTLSSISTFARSGACRGFQKRSYSWLSARH